jgi:hypothetical protein
MRGFGVVNGTGRAAVGRLSPAFGGLPGRKGQRGSFGGLLAEQMRRVAITEDRRELGV